MKFAWFEDFKVSKMKRIFYMMFNLLNIFSFRASEIIKVDAYLGYQLDLKFLSDKYENIQACIVETPARDSKILWTGLKWENSRMRAVVGDSWCKVQIHHVEQKDEGDWNCQLYFTSSNTTIIEKSIIQVTIETPYHDTTTESTDEIFFTFNKENTTRWNEIDTDEKNTKNTRLIRVDTSSSRRNSPFSIFYLTCFFLLL